MEVANLLVAIMFSTILVMGLGNVLVDLATLLNEDPEREADGIGIGWKLLVLLVHFNLFWNTKAVVEAEQWDYLGFLFVIAGPILMFLATSLLLSARRDEDAAPSTYAWHSSRFFFVLAVLQIWIIGADISLGRDFSFMSGINLVVAGILTILGFARSRQLHWAGLASCWVASLVSVILQIVRM